MVQCLRIGLGGTQTIPIDQCLVADIPLASEPCNTLACPSARVQVIAPSTVLACDGPSCMSGGNSSNIPLQILCRSSVG